MTLGKGKSAENKSVRLLQSKGYKIIKTNWRYSHLEVDIIAENNDFIVFVEVKMRNNTDLNFDEIVSRRKQRNIINAADKFINKYEIDKEARFDVIIVSPQDIKHIEAAFYPEIE